MVLIYKHGGFYSDLDVVTIKDMSNLHYVIGWAGYVVASGDFHMERNHPVLWKCMDIINRTYQGYDRIEIGPNLMTRVIIEHFHIMKDVKFFQSPNLTVLHTQEE